MNAISSAETRAVGAGNTDPQQYLTFMLGGDIFAIGILSIKEIIEYQDLTVVPMVPPAVRGVINLRGAVVPVMDLQVRFGRAPSPVSKRTCIVIVEIDNEAEGERQVLGVIVDAVNEVLEIGAADIEPPPTFGTGVRSDFISGVGKVKGRFVLLLAVGQALSIDALAAAREAAQEREAAGLRGDAATDR